jgi:hypothetical protein
MLVVPRFHSEPQIAAQGLERRAAGFSRPLLEPSTGRRLVPHQLLVAYHHLPLGCEAWRLPLDLSTNQLEESGREHLWVGVVANFDGETSWNSTKTKTIIGKAQKLRGLHNVQKLMSFYSQLE